MLMMIYVDGSDTRCPSAFFHLIQSVKQGKNLVLLDPLGNWGAWDPIGPGNFFDEPVLQGCTCVDPGRKVDDDWQWSMLILNSSLLQHLSQIQQERRFP